MYSLLGEHLERLIAAGIPHALAQGGIEEDQVHVSGKFTGIKSSGVDAVVNHLEEVRGVVNQHLLHKATNCRRPIGSA